jgi:hypothetical protein
VNKRKSTKCIRLAHKSISKTTKKTGKEKKLERALGYREKKLERTLGKPKSAFEIACVAGSFLHHAGYI